jgi:hypothetical protein
VRVGVEEAVLQDLQQRALHANEGVGG